MAKDHIDINKIEARLGRLAGPPRADDGYDPIELAEVQSRGTENDSPLGVILFCSAAALLALAFGALVYFAGGDLNFRFGGGNGNFVSSVAAGCDHGWIASQENNDQMHCYMTRNVARLCDPDERAALVTKLDKYDEDSAKFHQNHLIATVHSVRSTMDNGIEFGIEASLADNESLSDSERSKHMDNAITMSNDMLSEEQEFMKKAKHNDVPAGVVQQDVVNLVEKGYLSSRDFGWLPPDWAREAVSRARPAKSDPCAVKS